MVEEFEYTTNSPEETFKLGFDIAKGIDRGAVITLNGDLGCGKTVFTQGFAKGLNIDDYINSPTFTILQIYEEGRMPLYHFDVYRIGDISEMDEIGFEDYVYGDGVSLIEWAELIEEILPKERTDIFITKDLTKGTDFRTIKIIKN